MNLTYKKTVLVVEDSGFDRDMLTLFLHEKYNVITAENGLIAEQILESGQEVSVILLDIAMPVINGFDFLTWIQSKSEYRHIPIVFTSIAATNENILKGLQMGVRDVIFKPYDWGRVERCVENLLTLAQYQRSYTETDIAAYEKDTVLIVDDSQVSRSILKETLKGQYRFLEAANGAEALDMLRSHHDEIRLVLLDIIMPEMDGYEMMKIAKEEKLVDHIPVVAVTSEENSEQYIRMLEVGISEVVKKPFSPLIVQGRFKNLIDLYRHRRPSVLEPVPAGVMDKKDIQFPTGMFHLKYSNGWECVYVSDDFLEFLNSSKENFLDDLSDWIVYSLTTGERITVKTLLQELAEEPGTISYVGDTFYRGSEDIRRVKSTLTSFRSPDGVCLYGMIVDTSRSRKLVEANEALLGDFHLLQKKTGEMLFRYIIQGRCAVVNTLMAKQKGISEIIEDLPEWNVRNGFIAEESIDDWYHIFDDIDSGKKYGSCKIMLKPQGRGEPRPYMMEYTGITDKDGKPYGALIYYELITEHNNKLLPQPYEKTGMSMAALRHYYEIVSVNLTKGTCRLIQNHGANQPSYTLEMGLNQILEETYETVAPEYKEDFKNTFFREAQLASIAKGEEEISLTYLRRSNDNEWVWIESVATRQYNPHDEDILVCVISRMLDENKVQARLFHQILTDSVEKQEGWNQYEALSGHIFHGLAYAEYDDGRPSSYAIGSFANVMGCSPRDLVMATSANIPREDREKARRRREEALLNREKSFTTDYRIKTIQGAWVWVLNKATRFTDKSGNEGYIYFLVDNTYEQTLNEQLHRQRKEVENLRRYVQTDDLTGTYSRQYFFEKAEEMIRSSSSDVYIVRTNISHFKVINELQGAEKSDLLLKEIGKILWKLSQKEGFVVGRFSADKFYMCISKDVFEKTGFVKKISISWLDMDINLTYGVYPVAESCPISVMCDRADMALNAKGNGSSEYIHYYDDTFRQKLMREKEIESEMEEALAKNQFCIYIQPKFDADKEQIIGGEALVRWNHPEKGIIPPGVFIEVFEKNGFIRDIDYFVWEESCRFMAEAKKKGLPQLPLSVNVSRIHFFNGAFREKLTELIEKYGLKPSDLELEITENICAEEPDIIYEQCRCLRELGFKISMDDFGSGYSSLNMLRYTPLDTIKMDIKFLAEDGDFQQKMKGRDILRTQIDLAHAIGLDVVVEGVETSEQLDFIREIGSCGAQGYYFAKPMPAVQFEGLLQTIKVDASAVLPSQMAASLRRERLRMEQCQPLLEMIYAGKNVFGYLLPDGETVMPAHLAEELGCPQRVPNLLGYLADSGFLTPASLPQCRKLVEAVERGERYGSAVVEYINPQGDIEPHWLRFNTDMDFEGNPLMAVFSVSAFDEIAEQVASLMESRKSKAEEENIRLKEQVEETQQIFQIVADHSNRTLYVYDLITATTRPWEEGDEENDVLAHLYGGTYSEEGLKENPSVFEDRKETVKKFFADIHAGVPTGEMNVRVKLQDGEARWYHFKYSSVFQNGQPISAVISVEDITERHEHELAYLRMQQAMASNVAGNLMNVECDLTDDRVEKVSGFTSIKNRADEPYSVQEIMGEIRAKGYSFVDEEAARAYFTRNNFITTYVAGEWHDTRQWQVCHPDGTEHWMDTELTMMEDPYNKHMKMFLWLRDVTAEKRVQLEIKYRSQRDGMTGLYNRNTTEELIREKIGSDAGKGIFIILDMDRLKQINDSYGHGQGDEAIVSVARILRAHFRSSDIIGRFGGDEFVIYMPGAAKNQDVISGTITELLRKLGALSVGDSEDMAVTCSIGCAVEQKDSTYDSLYKQADRALYHVKKSGRNNFAFYSAEMDSSDFIYHMDKLFSLDYAKRSESGEVKQLLTVLCEIYHLVLSCNITENKYHLMQEIKDGIFAQIPTFGKMDTMVNLSMMRMKDEDAKRFDNAVSRHALTDADARGEKHVTIHFDFLDINNEYKPAECNSILYRNEKGDLCEFALIRWMPS